jgi:hypothetical protein
MIGVISAQLLGVVISVMKQCGNESDPPNKRWGNKHVNALKGLVGNPKTLGSKISQRPT